MTDQETFGAKHDLEVFRVTSLPRSFYYIPNFISAEEEASILQKIPAQRWTHLSHRRLQAIPSTLTKNNTLLASPLPAYLTTPVVDRFKALGIFEHTPHQQPNHVLVNEYRPGEGIMPHEDGDAYAPVVATVSLGAALCLDVVRKPAKARDEEDGSSNRRRSSSENGPVAAPEDQIHDGEEEKEEASSSSSSSTNGEFKLPTRIYQERRSLLVTTGAAYCTLMHGISGIAVDEGLNEESVANWQLVGDTRTLEAMGGMSARGVRTSLTYRDVLRVSAAASKVLGGGFPRK
ncbi:hypothetical protein ACJBU6_03653 [Exserohilum turcicum]